MLGFRPKKYQLISLSIAAMMVAMSFKCISQQTRLFIRFENYVGDKKLALDTATYSNSLGQPFTVTNFKYYISNIELDFYDTKKSFLQNGYSYLIRQDDKDSWTVELDGLPEGRYDAINFMIGVDSLHNCSGAQSGALDPINGMFWTWSTGYIFMKLEGKSPASNQPGHLYEYHIGGYREPNNLIRNVSLRFDNGPMKINPGKATTIYIKTDAAKILNSSNKIDFSKLSSVTDFHNSATIADNYKDMFSIIRLSNEW